ncbi:MAG: hypothetical protein O2913_10315 [Chloroflexi bacterium]|nr:hypothetical protein [Chloroflexota bacterium]
MKLLFGLVIFGTMFALACGSSSAPTEPTSVSVPTSTLANTSNLEGPATPTPRPTATPTRTPTALPTATPPATNTPAPPPLTGLWEYDEERDVITDKLSQGILTLAVSGESRFGEPIRMYIGCIQPDFFSVHFSWDTFIDLDSTVVTYRIDSQDSQTSSWSLLSDGDLTYLSGATAKSFVISLWGGKQLLARVLPYSGPPLTATFDITGIEEAAKPIFEGCPSQ